MYTGLINPFRTTLIRLAVCLACGLAGSFGVNAQEDESRTATPTTGSLSGRVVNENGEGLPHVSVYLMLPGSMSQPRFNSTDENGNFEFTGLDPSLYRVRVSAPSYVSTSRDSDFQPTYYRIGDKVTITLLKGGVMTGTVTTATGEPMVQAGVRAFLIRDANGETPPGSRFAVERLTDDRGVYRIYGLAGGTYVVSAGARGSYSYLGNAYDNGVPTYAPSSPRDTASEIVVRAGEEIAGVDIRYRGEPGHTISGVVSGPSAPDSEPNVTLRPIVNGSPQGAVMAIPSENNKGFAFYGLPDGDYDLFSQSYLGDAEIAASEPLRVTVKGADVAGIKLEVKGLASIKGHVSYQSSAAPECRNKRKPPVAETLFIARREKTTTKEELLFPSVLDPGILDASGGFLLRNLGPGQFSFNVRFFAKYWYLRSITREVPGAPVASSGATNRQTDLARTGIELKFGERIVGVAVTLAEGAASLHGAVKLREGEKVPAKLFMNLLPAEKESTEDVLRFFTTPVNSDGTFAVNNIAPGRYWALPRVVGESEPQSELNLRSPIAAEYRTQLRRTAEAAKTSVELKPCQNVSSYEAALTTITPKPG